MIDPKQHRAAVDLAVGIGMRMAMELRANGIDDQTIKTEAERRVTDAMAQMKVWWFSGVQKPEGANQ